jgi:N-acetylglucosamine-6-phosphate deacetylase
MIHSEVKIVEPTAFRCDVLLDPGNRFAPGLLRVSGGLVVSAGPDEPGAEAIPLAGTVVPGFVDLQVNGFGPHDLRDGQPSTVGAITRELLAHGVTTWLPTIVSTTEDVRLAALDAIAADGSALGVHLEGPWLNPVRAGAHDPAALRKPEPDEVARSIERHDGLVRIVTLAPELDGGTDAIRILTRAGVVASMGHTDATLHEAMAGLDAGARMVTHLFNAMRPLHHRDPGVVTAALVDDRITCGLIADGEHVHPTLVGFTLRSRDGHAALVSDVVAGPPGQRTARLGDGTLAGSLVALDEGVRVAVSAGVDLVTAVTAATATPAALLGEPIGCLSDGCRADFVVLDDDLHPTATYMGGELVWARNSGWSEATPYG